MKERIEALKSEISASLDKGMSREDFAKLREKYLSKTGEIPNLMKAMKDIPKEERPEFGKIVNEFKVWAEGEFDAVDEAIKKAELEAKNLSEAVDVTMPATKSETGNTRKKRNYKYISGYGL